VTGLSLSIFDTDTGVKTLSVVVSDHASLEPTDRLVLAVVGSSTATMTTQTFTFTPDQSVDIDLLKVTDWKAVPVCASGTGGDSGTWTDLDNSALEGGELSANDGDEAGFIEIGQPGGATSPWLVATGAIVSGDIPGGATLYGKQVALRRKDDAVGVAGLAVDSMGLKGYQEGSIVGSDFGETGVAWTSTETRFVFGEPGEIGDGWTRAQLIAANSGFVVNLVFEEGVAIGTDPTHAFDMGEERAFYEEAASFPHLPLLGAG
jgi:hypothetical protein